MGLKKWENLTITDNFIFSAVMQDDEICKKVIETLLGFQVGIIATELLLVLYCRLKSRSSASSSLDVALATTRLLFLE